MKLFKIGLPFYLLFMLQVHADENYVTIYNENLGLVKQVRDVVIKKEQLPLKFADVAARIIPTSVHLRSLTENQNFHVLEQNFEYDLVSSDKILEKYIDHPVEIIKESGDVIRGILLSKEGNGMVLKTEEGIKIIGWNNKMSVNVKDLPEGLITRPTLIWELADVTEGKQSVEVSYLTEGINWHAEYVGVLSEKANRIQLDAWVSIENNCGATFTNAHLKLVAGDIHRAPPERRRLDRRMPMATAEVQKGFEERAFFEYHIYELDRLTSIKNRQIKQISLFPPAQVRSQKKFYYNAAQDPKKVEVRVVFTNDEKAGLGRPLPAGIFRIYQEDEESLEFIGEDRIDHTPRNQEIKIAVGNAFDLLGERKVVDQRKISQRSERQTIEIELHNTKKEDEVTIIVEENLYYRNWNIEESNYPYEKKDARTIEFKVPVKANSTSTVRYTLTYAW